MFLGFEVLARVMGCRSGPIRGPLARALANPFSLAAGPRSCLARRVAIAIILLTVLLRTRAPRARRRILVRTRIPRSRRVTFTRRGGPIRWSCVRALGPTRQGVRPRRTRSTHAGTRPRRGQRGGHACGAIWPRCRPQAHGDADRATRTPQPVRRRGAAVRTRETIAAWCGSFALPRVLMYLRDRPRRSRPERDHVKQLRPGARA